MSSGNLNLSRVQDAADFLKAQSQHSSSRSVADLARNLGFVLLDYPHCHPIAHTRWLDGQWHIALSEHLSPEERDFTIAHEIGHVLLKAQDESLADAVAAEFFCDLRLEEALQAFSEIGLANSQCVSQAFSRLYELQRHLLDPDKRKQICATIALCAISSLGSLLLLSALTFADKLIQAKNPNEA